MKVLNAVVCMQYQHSVMKRSEGLFGFVWCRSVGWAARMGNVAAVLSSCSLLHRCHVVQLLFPAGFPRSSGHSLKAGDLTAQS